MTVHDTALHRQRRRRDPALALRRVLSSPKWPHGNLATIDFETRSACDLLRHGAWLYARHPSTEAMVLSYRLPGGVTKRWHMGHPQHFIAESDVPQDLFDHIERGGLVEAHNAFFEKCIWFHVMVKRHGWPKVPEMAWRCSAAKASAAALPRGLDGAVKAMELGIEKDMPGNRLMKKMSKPRKPRKAELEEWRLGHGDEPMPLLWHEDEADIYRLWAYCDTDVDAEHAFSDSVRDLSDDELRVWQLDQRMNWKGVRFDLDLAKAALHMAGEYKKKLNEELRVMTGVSAATKRAAVKDWLAVNEGVELPDTAAPTLDWFLEREEVSGRARRVIEIMKQVNRTSTKKFQAVIDRTDPDDWRARDQIMYHGAGTGRWSGKGIQVHNFPKGDIEDMDEVCADILDGDVDWCLAMYGDVMEMLSGATRGTVVPAPGHDLMVADYAAIEARCILWLANAQTALQVFLRGDDIYCDMATGIYGFQVKKGVHKPERQFGKQAILGLGFGMGFVTFLLTCRKYGIHFGRDQALRIMGAERLEKYEAWVASFLLLRESDRSKADGDKRKQAGKIKRRLLDAREVPSKIVHELALMKFTVDVYRTRYPEVKEMWKAQEDAAIRAVETGERVACGKVEWYVEKGFLYCVLPSGRELSYRAPEVKMQVTSWGEARPGLRYMSTGKGGKFVRTATYGGKLVENITQAVARDVMAAAMIGIDDLDTPYDTIMSVHDELVCEVPSDEGSLEEFEQLMSDIPAWAAGCPIAAEAARFPRYRK